MTGDEADRLWNEHDQLVDSDVEGLGPVTAARILKRFRSIEKFRNASVSELASVEGISERRAENILESFNSP